MPRKKFEYEGPVGTVIEEGGYAASDIILIDDRSAATAQEPQLLSPAGGDEGAWWEGKSLFEIINEFEGRSDDQDEDHIVDKLKITIEVVE